uniref:Uncharacterized protein n=1 Tax=Glossina morsitans morsitans TaxID=37546 RepID=A0A1B0GEC6_GLOMM
MQQTFQNPPRYQESIQNRKILNRSQDMDNTYYGVFQIMDILVLSFLSYIHLQLISKAVLNNNFCYLEPYNFTDIVIEKRHTLQMFTCASEDADHNLMILIRENGKLNYIYAGNFLDKRAALLNDDFAKWISQGVEKLYVNLKHAPNDQLYKSVQKLLLLAQCLKKTDTIVKYHGGRTFAIHLNYEKLYNRFPKRVVLLSKLSIFSDYFEKGADDLLAKLDVGRIFVTDGVISEDKAKGSDRSSSRNNPDDLK